MKTFPLTEVEFTKAGKVFKPETVQQVIDMIGQKKITDLFVISHGWNNDKKEARELYQTLLKSINKFIESDPTQAGRVFGVMAIFWPSKKFADDELIPGGAASLSAKNTPQAKLMKQLKALKAGFDGARADAILAKAELAVKKMEKDSEAGAADFVEQMEKLVAGVRGNAAEPEDKEAGLIKNHKGKALLLRLHDAENNFSAAPKTPGRGGAASATVRANIGREPSGGAAGGIGDVFSGIFDGARNLLNFVTYYQMKERAGNVGALGVGPTLRKIKKAHAQVRLHLIGHSFGGRLVTAATASVGDIFVDTLVLLQSAFSHHSLAKKYDGQNDGFYRAALSKVKGPILISHTHNDKAVGLAYAIASRIARQTGSSLGQNNDLYGGMGANGAQKTPEATAEFSLTGNAKYNFKSGKVYNLLADSCITGHSDICGDQVGRVIVAALK